MASRRHRQSFDIYGKEIIFHDRGNSGDDYKIATSTGGNNTLDLAMNFISLNSKWRINIQDDSLNFEKYNTETQNFDLKFKINS